MKNLRVDLLYVESVKLISSRFILFFFLEISGDNCSGFTNQIYTVNLGYCTIGPDLGPIGPYAQLVMRALPGRGYEIPPRLKSLSNK